MEVFIGSPKPELRLSLKFCFEKNSNLRETFDLLDPKLAFDVDRQLYSSLDGPIQHDDLEADHLRIMLAADALEQPDSPIQETEESIRPVARCRRLKFHLVF